MDARTLKMQDKVAKLLRQAEDVAGTPEEGIFQSKAFELISKYGLEMSQVEAVKQGLDLSDLPEAIQWTSIIKGKYVTQQALLLHGIARALHCRTVYSKGRGTDYALHVFGVPRHIDRVKFLWEILRPQMLRLVEEVRPDGGFTPRMTYDWKTGSVKTKSTSGQLRSYRRAWIAGFAATVNERVTREEEKALKSAETGALVLYTDDKQRAEVALQDAFPSAKPALTRTRYNGAGYSHGERDGRNAAMAHALAS